MDERVKLGKMIEKAIKKKKMTLKEVSLETGIPVSTLHRWICGEMPMGIFMWSKLIVLIGWGG